MTTGGTTGGLPHAANPDARRDRRPAGGGRLHCRPGSGDGAAPDARLLRRPLLIEGEAGVGKAEVAKVLAEVHGTNLIRYRNRYEGLDQSTALYEWKLSTPVLLRHQGPRRR